jgi:hypothetical protein
MLTLLQINSITTSKMFQQSIEVDIYLFQWVVTSTLSMPSKTSLTLTDSLSTSTKSMVRNSNCITQHLQSISRQFMLKTLHIQLHIPIWFHTLTWKTLIGLASIHQELTASFKLEMANISYKLLQSFTQWLSLINLVPNLTQIYLHTWDKDLWTSKECSNIMMLQLELPRQESMRTISMYSTDRSRITIRSTVQLLPRLLNKVDSQLTKIGNSVQRPMEHGSIAQLLITKIAHHLLLLFTIQVFN